MNKTSFGCAIYQIQSFFSSDNSTPLWTFSPGSGTKAISIDDTGNSIAVASNKIYLLDRSGDEQWSYNEISKDIDITGSGKYIAGIGNNRVQVFFKTSSTPIWSSGTWTGGCCNNVAISEDGLSVIAGYSRGLKYFESSAPSATIISVSQSTAIKGDSVSFSGSGSDDDGTISSVPKDEDNTDYQNILEWVAEGNTIEEAD